MAKYKSAFVFFLFLVGFFLHFYHLNWGAPYYFHPDERNIASSVSQLSFPEQLNPKFFAYGSLPIYSIFFTGLLANNLPTCQLLWDSCEKSSVPFSQAIVISRFYSALFSTLLIPLMFFLGRKLKDEKTGFIAAILTTTSVGFIQFAHYGTFEMWLTFFGVLLFWSCVELVQKKSYFPLLYAAVFFGILLATKVSSIVLLPLPLLAILLRHIPKHRGKQLKPWMLMQGLVHATKNLTVFTVIILLIYTVSNPFMRLDKEGFTNSMRYESGVATGTTPVFYTGEFYDTIPVLFQLVEVYPFLLNPYMLLLAIPSFVFILFRARNTKDPALIFLVLFFLVLLLSQAVLFVKWTRYMVPTLPFIYLMIALTITFVLATYKDFQKYQQFLLALLITINGIFALSYFITAFVREDTRLAAATFAKERIPRDEPILSEIYDLGIVAFNENHSDIKLFNIYDLDMAENSLEFNEQNLQYELSQRDYIILPSQRIIKSRLTQPEQFPKGYKFYTQLFNGSLGYKKIYETPCDIFCKITYLGSPSFKYEQTANVFDRPTVYIFKKVTN